METNSTEPTPQQHVILFPFMSKDHTIPFLHLSRLLPNHHLAVTIIITPVNRPFITHHLDDTSTAILKISFPQNGPKIPAGVESTDNLPSMFLLFSFLNSTSLIQPHFEQALETLLLPVSFLISDAFLWWTLELASKFKIPRLNSIGFEFVMRSLETSARSFDMIVNSFQEIEPAFLDYWNREFLPKAWCVGPLCLAKKQTEKNKEIWKICFQ
ncbi:hypothetical protein UlMin_014977, partial [Ulmus minor]